jgi:hypothetical protein
MFTRKAETAQVEHLTVGSLVELFFNIRLGWNLADTYQHPSLLLENTI